MMNINFVTLILIAANAIISFKGFNDYNFFERYKFNVGGIKRGEQIRMFSSGFLHVDMSHLIFNMFTLYMFAPVVTGYLGDTQFLVVYLASLLAGSLLSLQFHKNEYHYSAVGASGAVSGIVYAAILLRPDMTINFFIPGWLFGIGYLLYSIYGMKNRVGNIGHDAHFGGAIAGYIMTLALLPSLFKTNMLMIILLAIPIGLLLVLKRLGKL